MNVRTSLSLLASLVVTGCAQNPFAPPSPPPPAGPPELCEMRIAAGLPLLEASLPGDVKAWCLLDTGAGNFTLLDQRLSSALGLKHELVRDPLMPSISYAAKVPFLEVDSIGRRDFTAYIAEGLSDRAEFAGLGVPVQGVLGAGWFRGHCLWLDWGNGKFTAEWPRERLARHVALPLRLGVSGELHVTVRVNGVVCDALIDTGSAETLLGKETADRLRVAYDANKLGLHRETAIGVGAVRDGIFGRLELATEELRDVSVLVVERRLPNADLVLGTEVLSHWGVILELGERPYLILDPANGRAAGDQRAPEPAPVPAHDASGSGQGVPPGTSGGA